MLPTEHVEGRVPASDHVIELHERSTASLGQRLAGARERMGLSPAEVGARLKLPVKLIGRLERDDYEGLTQGVFLQ
ncbi:MAG TPA: helix-turn-helix domain-containing protein, partial [Dokdonella sp.]